MNRKVATRLAKQALKDVSATVYEMIGGEEYIKSGPVNVADLTVLFKNDDGTWSVTDNGEEVVCRTETEVIRIICENLDTGKE